LKVKSNNSLTHDTKCLELEFPDKTWIAGLWPGGHFMLKFKQGEEEVGRPYTPMSTINQKGSMSFGIKVYKKNEEFPNGGKVSQLIEALKPGDNILVSGPIGMVKYNGGGEFVRKGEALAHKKKRIGLITGGSGITPHLSVVTASLMAGEDLVFTCIYSNKTVDDVMFREQLEMLSAKFPNNFRLTHTFTRGECNEPKWKVKKGRVTADMLKEIDFPEPADDVLILVCGPKGLHMTATSIMESGGYTEGTHYF